MPNGDNFGLFLCNVDLRIQEGHSARLAEFLSAPAAKLGCRYLPDLLRLSGPDASRFVALYQQVFEDVGTEEFNLSQLPNRFEIQAKRLSLGGCAIRDGQGKVKSVLFCLADVTSRATADQISAEINSVLKIAASKETFATFVQDMLAKLKQFTSAPACNNLNDEEIRLHLHTWKGNFKMFGLVEMVDFLHRVEDFQTITPDLLVKLTHKIKEFLAAKGADLQLRVVDLHDTKAHKPVHEMVGPLGSTSEWLARRLGKRVRFEMEGGDLAFPVSTSNVLLSIIHLVINSVDHGLETPAQRAGKKEADVIRLIFSESSHHFHIHFADDGRGMNPDTIATLAVKKGLVTEAEILKMNDQQKTKLVFRSGFSTQAGVTDISGRGMGLSAVAHAVEQMKGDLAVETISGKGTQFRIRIPRG